MRRQSLEIPRLLEVLGHSKGQEHDDVVDQT